eukprot:1136622-Pelagomonas_calceolata.AAC.1
MLHNHSPGCWWTCYAEHTELVQIIVAIAKVNQRCNHGLPAGQTLANKVRTHATHGACSEFRMDLKFELQVHSVKNAQEIVITRHAI